MRILVVEDNRKLADVIARALRDESYIVEVAHDGDDGLALLQTQPYDAAVVDVMLPGVDGFSIVRDSRRRGVTVPVIMLTARAEVADRVRGLDEGADDYLAKPFAVPELKARLRALMRRRDGTPLLRHGDIVLDPLKRRVTRDGEEVTLTAREHALLEYLMRHSGDVLTRMTLGEHVWDMNYEHTSNVVDVYVNYLRRKLDRPGEPSVITTVRGVGYRFG